jgi:hypothetical protein
VQNFVEITFFAGKLRESTYKLNLLATYPTGEYFRENRECQKRPLMGKFGKLSKLAKIARFSVPLLVSKSESQKLNHF